MVASSRSAYLARLAEDTPELELVAPAPLNIVCLRFAPRGVEAAALDDLNRDLLVRLQESGIACPSATTLNDRFCIRVAITNHRTRRADLDLLVAEMIRLGAELRSERSGTNR